MNVLRIALIGSRILETDANYAKDAALYDRVCYRLATLGVTMTSGLCPTGADAIAHRAYGRAIDDAKANALQLEVYAVNKEAVERSILPYKNIKMVAPPDYEDERIEIIRTVINDDHWSRCSDIAKKLHARNAHQILGRDLKHKVDAAIIWCPMLASNEPQGGTASGYKLCLKHNIPIFNLWLDDKHAVLEQIRIFLTDKSIID